MVAKKERHLAAIMFTDIVGYTALMQGDEAAASAVRDRHRSVLEEAVPAHGGELVQYFGDGTLSVFPSAVEAVAAAVQIQRDLQTYPKIPMRVGIHLGDIAYDQQGAYGDAVNVASRVEALGTPGSVLVSSKVVEELKNHPRFSTIPIGNVRLKNVKRPLALHAIAAEGIAVPTREDIRRRGRHGGLRVALVVGAVGLALAAYAVFRTSDLGLPGATAASDRPSIAVIPFDNLSPDPDNAYFAAGMHEQITSELAKISNLMVIARTSVMQYSGGTRTVREIAEELGVDFVLEGSARKDADRVRLTAQLIDTRNEAHLWAEDYDRDLTVGNLFAIQDDLAARVADALSATILPTEERYIAQVLTDDLEAYDLYLRGRAVPDRYSGQDAQSSERLFERAVEIDPEFAEAWAGLSSTRSWLALRFEMPEKGVTAGEALQRAAALDPGSPETLWAEGWFHRAVSQDMDRALQSFLRAESVLPNQPWGLMNIANIRKDQAAYPEALEYYLRALSVDPRSSDAAANAGVMHWALGEMADADRMLTLAGSLSPEVPAMHTARFYLYLWALGDTVQARTFRDSYSTSGVGEVPDWWDIDLAYLRRDYMTAIQLLRERRPDILPGLEHHPPEYVTAALYRFMGDVAMSHGYADSLIARAERTLESDGRVGPIIESTGRRLLGLAYALLGREQDAVREAETAVSLVSGLRQEELASMDLAQVHALLGHEDEAIQVLGSILPLPTLLVPDHPLLLDPVWDPLRGLPGFQALVEG